MRVEFTTSSDGSAVFVAKDETTGLVGKVVLSGLQPDTRYMLALSPVSTFTPVYKPQDPTTIGSEGDGGAGAGENP